MKIRVNNRDGKNVAECILFRDEYNNLLLTHSSNCLNVYADMEQGDYGFEEVIDIDVGNLISPKYKSMLISLGAEWSKFETLRSEFDLSTHDDDQYSIDILNVPHIYGYISDDDYNKYTEKLANFLQYDGDYYNNDEYTYEELDDFIRNLNPIYDIR